MFDLPRFVFLALLVGAGIVPAWCGDRSALDAGWADVEGFRFNDALAAFEKADSGREQAFGRAIALMNVQPRTQGNLRQSQDLFGVLARENPGDAIGALSQYYLGRIYHLHVEPADREKALWAYRAALDLKSGHPLVETAAVSLVNLLVYDARDEGALGRLEELESLGADLASVVGRREYHAAMGYAYLEFAGENDAASLRKGLGHLLEVDRLGVKRWQAESNLWVAIGEVSRVLGEKETARKYYRKFSGTYLRDRRNHLVSERLAELEKTP